MTHIESQPLILDSPEDLLVTIPFLLGFHPQNSLIVLSLTGQRRLARVMRAEIDVTNEREAARELISALTWQNIESVMLVAYTTGQSNTSFIELCENEIESTGFQLLESIVVSENSWHSRRCEGECSSCNHSGNPLPVLESSRVAAEHVIRGHLLPCASESDLASTLAYVGAELEITETSLSLPESAAHLRDMWVRWQGLRWLSPADVSAALTALENVALRDFAITMHDGAHLQGTVELWRTLLSQAPTGYRAPVASLLAATSYEAGEGGLARLALDEAFKDDPEYSLARLLARAMEAGWPSEAFTRMREELAEKLGALVGLAA
jgi:hypothetical protein